MRLAMGEIISTLVVLIPVVLIIMYFLNKKKYKDFPRHFFRHRCPRCNRFFEESSHPVSKECTNCGNEVVMYSYRDDTGSGLVMYTYISIMPYSNPYSYDRISPTDREVNSAGWRCMKCGEPAPFIRDGFTVIDNQVICPFCGTRCGVPRFK
jgi:ribosomal protein L37AE/L43A